MAQKRLVRSYAKAPRDDYENTGSDGYQYRLREMWPEIADRKFGMDGSVKLGKHDLEKLGNPQRIKVVIYNID